MQNQYLSDLQTLLNCREQVKTQARQEVDKQLAPQYWAIGEQYAYGDGVPKNAVQAIYWFEKAARYGNNALHYFYLLGHYYAYGYQIIGKDTEKAIYWWTKAAKQEDRNTQWILGILYADDNEGFQDSEMAAYWLEKSMGKCDYMWHFLELGKRYADGEGVSQDSNKAVYWLTKASEFKPGGVADFELGRRYADGLGIPQNTDKAVYFLTKAAEKNISDAQYELGWRYAAGQGVPQDADKAMYWLKKSVIDEADEVYKQIEKGQRQEYELRILCPRMFRLGSLYADGNGLPQDKEKAEYWLTKAAIKDHIGNTYRWEFGIRYADGNGLPQDNKKAEYWLAMAVENYSSDKNIGLKYLELGMRYVRGNGIHKNIRKAKYWLEKASDKDNQDARNYLDSISFKIQKELLKFGLKK